MAGGEFVEPVAEPADDGNSLAEGFAENAVGALGDAGEIQDEEKGSELLSIAASRWTENDRATAEAALDGGDLPEAARRALAEAMAAEGER